jgi:hypothetical protein
MTGRLLHADTCGYVAVETLTEGGLELVDSTVWPDLHSAREAVGDDGSVTVMAIVGLALFGPALAPCTHRRLRQITRELLQCEDCGAELDA